MKQKTGRAKSTGLASRSLSRPFQRPSLGERWIPAVFKEPSEAFRCRPPSYEVRAQNADTFDLDWPLPDRLGKKMFDRSLAITMLFALSPLIATLFLFNFVEGFLIPGNRGPFIYSYVASSAGKRFRKHKIRQIRKSEIDAVLAARGDWHAYAKEWSPESLTCMGRLVKALYLDELPQLWDIAVGHMSFVGPRPLAWHHYERDLAQGNVSRRLLKAGLLGSAQALKGTRAMGDPIADFEYLHSYRHLSAFRLFVLDLKIIFRGLNVVLRKRGL
jgi:lipopolysaccharide/colanic/teichoic acid biosynthesis glycosyltransferase